MKSVSQTEGAMRLLVHLPIETLVDVQVRRLVAEGEDGFFCLLPRHVDFVSALVPGVLVFVPVEGEETYAALDEGVLLKRGREVSIAALSGVMGYDLERLSALVDERYLQLDEQERSSRSALARLEAGALRGFRKLQGGDHV